MSEFVERRGSERSGYCVILERLTDEHGDVGTEAQNTEFMVSSKSQFPILLPLPGAAMFLVPFVSMISGKSENRF